MSFTVTRRRNRLSTLCVVVCVYGQLETPKHFVDTSEYGHGYEIIFSLATDNYITRHAKVTGHTKQDRARQGRAPWLRFSIQPPTTSPRASRNRERQSVATSRIMFCFAVTSKPCPLSQSEAQTCTRVLYEPLSAKGKKSSQTQTAWQRSIVNLQINLFHSRPASLGHLRFPYPPKEKTLAQG